MSGYNNDIYLSNEPILYLFGYKHVDSENLTWIYGIDEFSFVIFEINDG